MKWVISVYFNDPEMDAKNKILSNEIKDLIGKKVNIKIFTNYVLEGNMNEDELKKISEDFFIDKTLESFMINSFTNFEDFKIIDKKYKWQVNVYLKKFIINPNDEIIFKALNMLYPNKFSSLVTFNTYLFSSDINYKELELIINKLLANKLLHEVKVFENE
jgi:phosphoribosylformylglycinamidine (FGAM) synthase PurS component